MAALPPGLIERLAATASKIHPDKLEAVYRQLGKGRINSPQRFELEFQSVIRKELLQEICSAWEEANPVTGVDLGNTLLTIATLTRVNTQERSTLIATRPWDPTNSRTDSESAYLSVIGNARERLVLASYVVYNVQTILDALKEAAARGAQIQILLEPAQTSGGTLSGTHDSEALLRKIIPNASYYRPVRNKIRAVHAKFVCADKRHAFITSANVTAPALSRNIELGVMITNGPIPGRVMELFDELIQKKAIQPV